MELTVHHGTEQVTTVHANCEVIDIGSGSHCTIHLREPEVAELHARLEPSDEGWQLNLLESTPPTRVNGVTVEDRAVVRHGDEVEIGSFVLRVRTDDPAAPSPIAPQKPPSSSGQFSRPALPGQRPTIVTRELGPEASGPMRPLIPELSGTFNPFVGPSMVDPDDAPIILPPGTLRRKQSDPVTLAADRAEQLSLIARFLPSLDDPGSLLRLWHRIAMRTFNGHQAWAGIRLAVSGPLQQDLALGADDEPIPCPEMARKLRDTCLLRHQYVMIPPLDPTQHQGILAGPIMSTKGALGMAYVGQSPAAATCYNGGDLEFFKMVCQLLGAQLDHMIRREDTSEQRNGLNTVTSKAIQKVLAAADLEDLPGLAVRHKRLTGLLEASDVLDVGLAPDGRLACLLGTIEDAGPISGLALAQTQAAFRLAVAAGIQPGQILELFNGFIAQQGAGRWQMTAAIALVNPASGHVHYAHAGVPGLRVLSPRGQTRQLRHASQNILGARLDSSFETYTELLEEGEVLAVFSNGILRAVNDSGESYGRKRLADQLVGSLHLPLGEIVDDVAETIRAFMGGEKIPMDFSLLLIRKEPA